MDTLSTLRRRITTGRAVPTASLFAAAVLVVSGCGLTGNRDSTEPGPAGASPTVAPSTGAPSRATEPTDTRAWTTYTSAEYGFKVGHPADWKEIPATRDWRSDADAEDPLSSAHDAFQSPSDDVRVSVWNVPLDPRTSVGSSTDDLGAWVEETAQGQTMRREPGSTIAPSNCALRSGIAIPGCLFRSRTTFKRITAAASMTEMR